MITRFIHLLVLSGFIFSLHCTSVSLCCCKAQLVRCSDACCELIVFCKFESERNYVLDLIVRDQLFKNQKQVLRQRVSKRIILVICKWAIELDTGSSSSTCPPSSSWGKINGKSNDASSAFAYFIQRVLPYQYHDY